MTVDTMLWRRMDSPGHDSCRLVATTQGWLLSGTAVFRHQSGPARLEYAVRVNRAWRTRSARVDGWVGNRQVRTRVRRVGSSWEIDGLSAAPGPECVDLDLGFTPATNILQLRRMALAVGKAAKVPVAWWDVASKGLEVLAQRYERRTITTYWYEAPRFDFAELLTVNSAGFVVEYPGIWVAEG